MSLLIGVDLGTTSIKAVLYEPGSGRVRAVASRPTVIHHPKPGWTEFDPASIWSAVVVVVREVTADCSKGAVLAISVASMGEAGVPIGPRGAYLNPIIAWYDPRTEPLARWWAQACDPAKLYQITGLVPRHIYGLNKLLWLREHRPSVYRALRHWLSMEDFVLWKLSGQFVTDYSVASRTMAFDQRSLRWSYEVLALADVPEEILPAPLPSGTPVGTLTPLAAAELGLSTSTVAVTGGHDHLCGALAAGLIVPGSLLDSTGTAQAVLALTKGFHPSDRLRVAGLSYYHYVTEQGYVLQAGLSAAGGGLAWLAGILGRIGDLGPGTGGETAVDYAVLLEEAAAVPPGSNGLLWLPHLLGSGSPENDPDSRAAVFGLTISTTRGDLVRSLLESFCYWLRHNVDLFEAELGVSQRWLIAIGGSTKAPLWLQLKADITARPVVVPTLGEATAVGAALLAGIGVGMFADAASAVRSLVVPTTTYHPDTTRGEFYAERFRNLYLPLYASLRELNHRLAGHQ